MKHNEFTVAELLVIIAIIGSISALFVPAFCAVRNRIGRQSPTPTTTVTLYSGGKAVRVWETASSVCVTNGSNAYWDEALGRIEVTGTVVVEPTALAEQP